MSDCGGRRAGRAAGPDCRKQTVTSSNFRTLVIAAGLVEIAAVEGALEVRADRSPGTPPAALASWAEQLAQVLLQESLPRRWAHVQGVAARART
jgi:hypothetical protein